MVRTREMIRTKGKTDAAQRTAGDPEEIYWAAVAARDQSFDGKFFYAVATTGVYCRPSCAARLAKRENVSFHASCRDAEAAGFRPCKRCKPDEPPLPQRTATKIGEICRLIEAAEEAPRLDELARSAGLSPFHFHRVFKEVTGMTPKAYAVAHRNTRVRETLRRSGSVTEAIYGAGFGSSSRFYAKSSETLGMAPSAFRRGGTRVELRFAVGECSLGSFLVACSVQGVAAIFLGDDPDALVRELEDRFPRATVVGGDAAFEDVVAKVVGLVEAPQRGLDLPLDVQGTLFQQRVWEALRAIPAGTTATYSEIADRIGMPKAVRAVAQACAANRIAIAIPCHRVVRNDGALSGYRWGVERKSALIARESKR